MEHIQLTWTNWNNVCDFVGKENFIEGTYLDNNNLPTKSFNIQLDKLGLFIKLNGKKHLTITDEFIVKENGNLKVMSKLQFERKQKLDIIEKTIKY